MRRVTAVIGAMMWLGPASWAQSKATKAPKRPPRVYVVELPPDHATRGDWEPAYGRWYYILCGMRSPRSVRGGPGYPYYKLYTGSPKEVARAWLSGRRTKDDRRVLREPWSQRRTASVWDDHGEEYPIGKGPNLMIDVHIPKGRFRLSLYFFEIDWIQYRAYKIHFWREGRARRGKPLLSTSIDNFFNGIYKRFAVFGPAKLTVEITRELSPNATLSGFFLDKLEYPESDFIRDTLGPVPRVSASRARATAAKAHTNAAAALDGLVQASGGRRELLTYLKAEAAVLGALEALERGAPAQYYGQLQQHWEPLIDRVRTAVSTSKTAARSSRAWAMLYQARRALHDYGACSDALRVLADAVASDVSARRGKAEFLARLEALAVGALGDTACQDVRAPFKCYLEAVANHMPYDDAARRTARMARDALFANRPALAATAIETLQRTFPNRVRPSDLALLGNARLMTGDYEKGAVALDSALAQMPRGPAQAASMLSLLSCHLGAGHMAQAAEIYDKLAAQYPDDDSVAQAQERFARAHFDRHEYAKAEVEFRALLDMGPPRDLAEEAREFLEVIKYRRSKNDFER